MKRMWLGILVALSAMFIMFAQNGAFAVNSGENDAAPAAKAEAAKPAEPAGKVRGAPASRPDRGEPIPGDR